MENETNPLEFAKMSRPQKLAALMIILGPDTAAQILKNLDESEVESVSLEMSRLTFISHELQREVLQEFTDVAIQATTGTPGGMAYTKTVLEKSVGPVKATDILGRVSPAATSVASMAQITELEPAQLFNLLKQEQPQTIALVVSHLAPEKCSQVLMLMRSELRDLVVERLATLEPTPLEVVDRIVKVLNQRAGVKTNRPMSQTGGLKSAADILNSLDKNVSQSMLVELENRNPALSQAIREKMFTFEDLTLLDTTSMQKVMREVDMRDLAVALKTASPKLRTAMLASISKRAAETVNEEISFLGPLKKKDIDAAQQRIIESVRRLETDGEIEINRSANLSTDEVLV